MKIKILSLILIVSLSLVGCMSVPTSVDYNGKQVPAVSPASAGCNKPYQLDQDCSGLSGAKRKIDFEGHTVKIAGSQDGSVILIMANKSFGFETMKLTVATSAIESFLIGKGFNVVETTAMAANGEVAGYYFVFDGDVYSVMKEFTIED